MIYIKFLESEKAKKVSKEIKNDEIFPVISVLCEVMTKKKTVLKYEILLVIVLSTNQLCSQHKHWFAVP